MISFVRNLSIRTQLALLCLIIIVPLLAFEAVQIRREYRTLYEHEVQANLEIARAARTAFLTYVNNLLRAETAIIVGLTQYLHTDDDISRALKEYEDKSGLVLNLGWLNPQGRVVASSLPSAIGLDLSDRPHVIAIAQGKDWSIGDLVLGRTTKKPVFAVCRAVRDDSGSLTGILVATVDEELLHNELSFQRSKSAGISIADRNGMLVFRYPRGAFTWEERDWLKAYPFMKQVQEGNEYTGTILSVMDGERRIAASIPLPFGWTVGAGRREEEVVGAVLSQIRATLAIFGAILLLALLAVAVVSKQITRSFLSLREKSDAIGRGDYIAKERLSGTKEFQVLSKALNTMSEKVHAREEALREHETKLSALIEQLPVGVGVLNAGGKFILNNTQMKQLIPHTMPSKDPERKSRWSTLYPDGSLVPPAEWPGARALRGETVLPGMEFQHMNGDGSIHWMVVSAVPFRSGGEAGAIVVVHDITKRKQTEEELRASEEKFRRIFQTSASMTTISSLKEERFIDVNKAFTVGLGFTRQEVIGRTASEIGTWADHDDRKRAAESVSRNGNIAGLEIRLRTKSGDIRTALLDACLMDIGDERCVVASFMDVTERKAAEEALRSINESLESKVRERTADLHAAYKSLEDRAAQLRALAGELTTAEQRERRSIAKLLHDGLQQFLVAARMRQNTLIGELGNHAAKQSAQEVEGLLTESINVSRTLATELSPPVLDGGICAGLEWLSRFMASKHGLNVNLVMETTGVSLAEDVKIFLFESIRELLLNVVKHSKTLAAKVLLKEDQQRLCVTVSDSGGGFDVCALTKHGGQGFGLFSIRERIELVGGCIEIDSSPGNGARFTLSVPLAKHDSMQATPVPPCGIRTATGVVDGRIRILLADDHSVIRESLAQMLGAEDDFEIVGQARDGNMAVELVHALQPNVVLMDIGMPNMDGVTATRIIAQRHPAIHVIGLSFYKAEERADELIQAGAKLYVSKTAPADELKRAIRSCVGGNSAKDQAA